MRLVITLLVLMALSSCQSASPTAIFEPEDQTKAALVESECAIYFAVLTKLANEDRQANGNIAEGCPSAAIDIVADIEPRNQSRQIESRYGTILYQRMIARGMPKDIADEVAKSNAFFDIVQDTDTVYLRR